MAFSYSFAKCAIPSNNNVVWSRARPSSSFTFYVRLVRMSLAVEEIEESFPRRETRKQIPNADDRVCSTRTFLITQLAFRFRFAQQKQRKRAKKEWQHSANSTNCLCPFTATCVCCHKQWTRRSQTHLELIVSPFRILCYPRCYCAAEDCCINATDKSHNEWNDKRRRQPLIMALVDGECEDRKGNDKQRKQSFVQTLVNLDNAETSRAH